MMRHRVFLPISPAFQKDDKCKCRFCKCGKQLQLSISNIYSSARHVCLRQSSAAATSHRVPAPDDIANRLPLRQMLVASYGVISSLCCVRCSRRCAGRFAQHAYASKPPPLLKTSSRSRSTPASTPRQMILLDDVFADGAARWASPYRRRDDVAPPGCCRHTSVGHFSAMRPGALLSRALRCYV